MGIRQSTSIHTRAVSISIKIDFSLLFEIITIAGLTGTKPFSRQLEKDCRRKNMSYFLPPTHGSMDPPCIRLCGIGIVERFSKFEKRGTFSGIIFDKNWTLSVNSGSGKEIFMALSIDAPVFYFRVRSLSLSISVNVFSFLRFLFVDCGYGDTLVKRTSYWLLRNEASSSGD